MLCPYQEIHCTFHDSQWNFLQGSYFQFNSIYVMLPPPPQKTPIRWLTLTPCRTWGVLVEASTTNTILCQVTSARSGPTPVFFPRASGYWKQNISFIYLETNRSGMEATANKYKRTTFTCLLVCCWPIQWGFYSWAFILAFCTLEVIGIGASCI